MSSVNFSVQYLSVIFSAFAIFIRTRLHKKRLKDNGSTDIFKSSPCLPKDKNRKRSRKHCALRFSKQRCFCSCANIFLSCRFFLPTLSELRNEGYTKARLRYISEFPPKVFPVIQFLRFCNSIYSSTIRISLIFNVRWTQSQLRQEITQLQKPQRFRFSQIPACPERREDRELNQRTATS